MAEKRLTKEIAEQFLTDNSVDLTSFTELDDDAAESLSRHVGALDLSGLTSLSELLAKNLSRCGGVLYLNGLTSLSDAAAESLSKYRGDALSLDGLTSLSDAAAESLSKHQEGRITWYRMSQRWGNTGFDTFVDDRDQSDYEESVTIIRTGLLSLGGLTSLSDASAKSLGKYKGQLSLNGLASLSDAAAESLSKCEGELELNGLFTTLTLQMSPPTELSDTVPRDLADRPGFLCLRAKMGDSLDGLTSLSDEAAESLSRFEGDLSLYVSSLSDAAAESLSWHRGWLSLCGLTSLSDAAAERLSWHEGRLFLMDLTELSDSPGHIALAENLATCEEEDDEIEFLSLTSLSDAAAERLSKYRGHFAGIDLDKLSESAAKILRQHHSFQDDE